MNLRKKIVLIGAAQLVALTLVLFVTYYFEARGKVQSQYVEKARAIVLTAESVREEMGKKWTQKIFTTEMLTQWAREGHNDKILAAVPVVTAWRAAMAKAEEGGYQFRVPKFQPRNPKNEPDETEARILRMFEKGTTEHF